MDEDKSREQYKRELFIKLLLMLHAGALQHLGKIENPITKKKEVRLDLARETIDMLDLLKEKTRGNLEDFEASTLENLIAELKITYVKVESEQAKKGSSEETPEKREADGGDKKDI
jgi:PBP1b-binding outer membrane lipoprotein LpoB